MNSPSKAKPVVLSKQTNTKNAMNPTEIPQPAIQQTGMADAGSMDKIRDILFGNQAKDYEKRFVQMENLLSQETAELKEEMLKRIDSLEIYIKQEIKDINDRIKSESSERAGADKSIQKELKDAVESLNQKLAADEENLAKKSTELREQILEQSKQLSTEILSKYDQASNNLKQSVAQLDETKVNRSDLSGFFLEIAMRLSGEGGIIPAATDQK